MPLAFGCSRIDVDSRLWFALRISHVVKTNGRSIGLVGDSGTHESSSIAASYLSLSPRLLIRRRRFSRSRFYERIDKCSLSLSVCPRGLIAEAILSPISGSRVTLWFPVAAVLMTRAATSTSTWTMIAARSACNVCLFESATSTECCMRVCKFVYRKIH